MERSLLSPLYMINVTGSCYGSDTVDGTIAGQFGRTWSNMVTFTDNAATIDGRSYWDRGMPSSDEAVKVEVTALGAAVRARLEEQLRRAFPGLLERWPVQECVGLPPAACGQGYDAGAELRRRCAEIVRVHGRQPKASWLRLLLCLSIGHAEPQLPALRLTHDIHRLYRREWCRILDAVESLPDAFFNPTKDKFQKDLALARLRLIPAGAGLVDPTYRVTPRFLLARGPWQAVRGASFLLVRAAGLGPYYRFHLDSRFLREFTSRGWEQTYLRIADLLELNPEMLGVVRSSWFLDPALETISPHLVYLRRTIVDHGGAVFYSGRSANVTRDALAKSATRRRLHAQGKYNPAEYLAIWPRRGLLRWARAMRAGGAGTGGPGTAEPPAGDALRLRTGGARWTRMPSERPSKATDFSPGDVVDPLVFPEPVR